MARNISITENDDGTATVQIKPELAIFLAERIVSKKLYVSIPTLGYTFGGDNCDEIVNAIVSINHVDTPMFIRQFTKLDSTVSFVNDVNKYYP